ncbi:MAG: AarF/UbiB family protein [Clostridia bacterium]
MPTDEAAPGRGRLKEILGVLSKHNVIAGVTPQKLCDIVEELGPTFVKLGQIMSMRQDMLPAAYCEELQKLRTNASPMPLDEVRRVIEGSLGIPLSEAFPSFSTEPLGSASIAQVHRARLADGTEVVVKVQREGIHDMMREDIALLRKAAALMKLAPVGETIDLGMVLDEMWVVSQEEMNFTTEAQNAEEFARLHKDISYVRFPAIYRKFSTHQVLVMEYVEGYAIDDQDALEAAGYDIAEIAQKLCVNYMKQVLDDGFFHADPHPGNLRVQDGCIVWLDMGMVGHLSARDQTAFDQALRAFAQHDTGGLTDGVLAIGIHRGSLNRAALFADVDDVLNEYVNMDVGEIDLGRMVQQVLDIAQKHDISMPSGVSMLGRGLATLQGTIAEISPNTSIMAVLSKRFASRALYEIDWKKHLERDAAALYESGMKSLNIPALAADTLRLAQKGQLKLIAETRVPPESEQRQNERWERACSYGLCGAFFLGGSLMTLMPGEPKLNGLPIPALIGFALSALAYLVPRIKRYRKDKRS